MEDYKRIRSNNWEVKEKETLINAVKEFITIIENKKNNHVNIQERVECWKKIQLRLAAAGYNREVSRIKQQWRRMKLAAKRNVSRSRRTGRTTGDSSPDDFTTRFDNAIAELIPAEINQDTNSLDSDSNMVMEPSKIKTNNSEEENDFLILSIDDCDAEVEVNCAESTSENSNHTETKSKPLTEYERQMLLLHKQKISHSIRIAQEMHELRVKHEKNLHEERMRILRHGRSDYNEF